MHRNPLIPLALLSGLLALSCTDTGEEGPLSSAAVTLHNAGQASVWYVAVERELSNLIDLVPSFLISESDSRLVPPGRSVSARIEGYAVGKDIRLFIYRVSPGDPSRASMAGHRDISARDLEANRGLVLITDP